MPIVNETVYNKEAMRSFILFNAVKTKKWRMLLSVLAGLVAFAASVLGMIQNGVKSVYAMFCLALLFLFASLCSRWFLAPYFQYKKTTNGRDVALSFTFYTRDFVAQSERVHAKRNSGVRYGALESVYETKQYYYLYPSATNAFIVSKDSFAPGGEEAFRTLLRREVDDNRLHLKKK